MRHVIVFASMLLCSCSLLQRDVETPVGTINIAQTGAQVLTWTAGALDGVQLGQSAQEHDVLCGVLASGAGAARWGAVWFKDLGTIPAPEASWELCTFDVDPCVEATIKGAIGALGQIEFTPTGFQGVPYDVPDCL